MQIPYTAKGIGGEVTVTQTSVIINRKGFFALMQNLRGSKEISISNITAVQFKKPGLTNGFIQFSFSGSSEKSGGSFKAASDENSVVFSGKHLSQFEYVRDLVNYLRNQPVNPAQPANNGSISDLEKLAELKERGIITEDEFAAKKQQILGL